VSECRTAAVEERARLSPAEARQVDRACDRFEAEWLEGRRPRPEAYLGAVGESIRSALLRQLLLLDWDYRRRAGEHPRAADYEARFPADATLIGEVCREAIESVANTRGGAEGSSVTGVCEAETVLSDPSLVAASGKFELVKEVGHGGIGVVFRGRDRHLGRELAVKVLREAYRDKPEARRRLIAEARIGSQLQHPAIVPVYEQGWLDDRRPYFTMKLVEGHTLAALLRGRAEPGQDLPRFLGVFEQVCQAMAYAHARGVVHRDLKPANVMVGAFGEVQVMDWGFAKAVGSRQKAAISAEEELCSPPAACRVLPADLSQSGAMMGTPAYMPPEQARGESGHIGPQADVFALGAILCEILTGRPPYVGGTADEIWRRAADGELAETYARLADCEADDALRELARRCLAPDRGQRPADAEVVARELTSYLASAQERLRQAQLERAAAEARAKAERRARRLLLALAAAVLCGSGVAVWEAIIANRAKHDAFDAAAAQRQAREAADAKEAETSAVLDFVQKRILAAARPEGQDGGLGRDVTLRRALEAAVPVVDKSFAKQPITEARLRTTLGHSFRQLGDLKTAAEQFRRARAIYAEHLGRHDLETLASVTNLSVCYYALGRHAEALKLREEVLAGQRAVRGPDDPETVKCMCNVANSYGALGRHAEAVALHERALPLFEARLGRDHPDTITSIHNLANSYYYLGRHAEAVKLREEVVTRRTTILGPDHPDTLLAMYNLGISYSALGRPSEAIRLGEETVARQKPKLGPDHPDTLASMNLLAGGYSAVGRHADAAKLAEQVLALRCAKLGPDHVHTVSTMSNLARIYECLGRNAEALQLREEVLARRRSKQGPDHPDALAGMHSLALSYRTLGRLAEAQKLLEQTVALNRAKLGPDHPETLSTMGTLGAIYGDLGRHTDALEIREQAFAILKNRLGPDHPETLRLMAGVINSLMRLDRGAEALPLIDECVRRAATQAAPRWVIPEVMEHRLRHFEKAKDADGCQTTAEMWERVRGSDADSLYGAACFRAVSAAVIRATDMSPTAAKRADGEADRAMTWLKKAVADGYKNVAHMEKDADVDALRDRADFRKLMAELKGDD